MLTCDLNYDNLLYLHSLWTKGFDQLIIICCVDKGLLERLIDTEYYLGETSKFPHTNQKKPSVSSHTLVPTTICDLSHSSLQEPTDRSGSHKLSHLRLSSFVVCLWSQKGNFDISLISVKGTDMSLICLSITYPHILCHRPVGTHQSSHMRN